MIRKILFILAVLLMPALAFANGGKEGESTAPSDKSMAETVNYSLAGESADLMVGASVRDVTPTGEMFPLFRMPNVTIDGVLDPLHVRVIALSDGHTTALMVCTETGRAPYGPQYVEALAAHTGLPGEAIFYTATHSHAAPEVTSAVDLYFESTPDHDGKIPVPTANQLWAKMLMEKMFDAADEALADMRPASVGIGYGESFINVNRRSLFNSVDKEGHVTEGFNLGWNPAGLSDQELITLRFNDAAGEPIAFIVNHATHGTVMHANNLGIDGKTGVSADFQGLVSSYLEREYDGAVAMWVSGAAGDQNPIMQFDNYTPNPETGVWDETISGTYGLLEFIAKWHFNDVKTALSRINDYKSHVPVAYSLAESSIPLRDGGKYEVALQTLRIGDIAFIGFPGEMFTSTGMYLKDVSPLENTIIVNHTWQRRTENPGYYPDDKALTEGGGMAGRSKYLPGYLNPELESVMDTLLSNTAAWIQNGDGTATNRESGKTVILGMDGQPGTEDDNRLVSPAGKTLMGNVDVSYDKDSVPFADLGNGFHVYAGRDNKLGTTDDLVKGFGRFMLSGEDDSLQPMNWRLVDVEGSKATLASEFILAPVAFNLKASDGNEWADSNIRNWMNSTGGKSATGDTVGFYDTAFSSEEKAKILKTTVSMNSSSSFVSYDKATTDDNFWKTFTTKGKDSQDYVWALSGEDVFEYYGLSLIATEKETGWAPENYSNANIEPSPWAIAHGVKFNTGGNGPSFVGFGDAWLRSVGAPPAGDIYYGTFLGSMGSLNTGREVNKTYGALPLIGVKISGK